MYKLIAATLAGLYGVTAMLGEPAQASLKADPDSGAESAFTLASFAMPAVFTSFIDERAESDRPDRLSEGEAIEIAMAAGRELRAGRETAPDLRGLIAAVEADIDIDDVEAQIDDAWFVTGDRVNLREGPSTSNGVVGQVGLGDVAEILSDPADKWIHIRLADGTNGWIFGKYLSAERPT